MSYTVKNIAEETGCIYCGGPIYVGDTVYLDYDATETYCSRRCRRAHNEGKERLRNALVDAEVFGNGPFGRDSY